MLELLTDINDRVNAQVTYQTEQPGADEWQTRDETKRRCLGDCEDIAIWKYEALRDKGLNPELCYCIWKDAAGKNHAHMVCVEGRVVLDNIDTEVKTMAERHDLSPVYAVSHKGLRNWNSDRWLPVGQHSKFLDLVERMKDVQ